MDETPNEFRVMYWKHGGTSERCWSHKSTLAEAEADAKRIRRRPDTQRAWIESRVVTMWQKVAPAIERQ
jgi:hypothetical protein